jgi:hypothetical protein
MPYECLDIWNWLATCDLPMKAIRLNSTLALVCFRYQINCILFLHVLLLLGRRAAAVYPYLRSVCEHLTCSLSQVHSEGVDAVQLLLRQVSHDAREFWELIGRGKVSLSCCVVNRPGAFEYIERRKVRPEPGAASRGRYPKILHK